MLRSALLIGALVGAVLGYGYWHSVTHAACHVDMNIVTDRAEGQRPIPKAEVTFFDDSGHVLAKGIGDDRYNYVHLLHPVVGDCREAEEGAATSREGRTAWEECFEELSTWIPRWAKYVRRAEVKYGECRFENIPVTFERRNTEWPLWWVPLPHVGGMPYTYFRSTLNIDEKDCLPANPSAK